MSFGADPGTEDASPSKAFVPTGCCSPWWGIVHPGRRVVAIAVPALSADRPNETLGLVLLIVGLAQIVQSARCSGLRFAWCLALGVAAAVGGVLVYIELFPGIVTKTLVMAIVIGLHGLTQIAFW